MAKWLGLSCVVAGMAWADGVGDEESIRFDAFAATVNTRIITVGDVRAAMEPAVRRMRVEAPAAELEERIDRLFSETLERLIERELLAEEFTRREIPFPERMVDGEISRLVQERFGGRFSAFLDAMAAERLTLDRYRDRLRDEMKAMILYQEEVTRRIVVTPSALREEYARSQSEFVVPARVRVYAIELRGGEPEERRTRASEVRARLSAGEAFEDVARLASDGRRAEAGGDWGWMRADELHTDISAALSELEPGRVSENVEITDRLFLFRLDQREAEAVKNLDEVLDVVTARVRSREEQQLRQELLERLRRFHAVRVLVPQHAG